jgi:uncharacterized protein with HEPN domain
MTQPRLADYLSHMLRAARDARSFVEGMSREEFLADRRTQAAVVMSLVIIGEASARIIESHPEFADAHGHVPWRNMRGMRNRMAHGYFETDFGLVWDTVETALPQLMDQLSTLTAELGQGGPEASS